MAPCSCLISMQILFFPAKLLFPTVSSCPPSTAAFFVESNCTYGSSGRKLGGRCRAMVKQTVQGLSVAYAKEMERLSDEEYLLLAVRDAGGFEALVTGKTTDLQRIDVNERIVSLERLSPTPRPTTSPFLEGRWNFEWFGAGSVGLFAAQGPSTPTRLKATLWSQPSYLLRDHFE